MKYLMFHDIRDAERKFFPKRYELPYFYNKQTFEWFLGNLPPTCYNSSDPRGFVYTFDDGLVDHFWAAEKLAEKKFTGIFFIPAAPILSGFVVESHKIQFIIASDAEQKIAADLVKLVQKLYGVPYQKLKYFESSRWRENIWSKEMVFITRCLREFGTTAQRSYLIDFLFKKFVTNDEKAFATEFYLTYRQIQLLAEMGHLIGGHGYYSNDLLFANEKERKAELDASLIFTQRILNPSEQLCYAYANGGVNKDIHRDCLKVGFEKTFNTDREIDWANDDVRNPPIKRIDPQKYLSKWQCYYD